jgi:hypothetical protein
LLFFNLPVVFDMLVGFVQHGKVSLIGLDCNYPLK